MESIDQDIIHDHGYADYIDMDDETYLSYFKKNRVKKFLVPIFTDPWGKKMELKEAWGIARVKLLRYVKGFSDNANAKFMENDEGAYT